MSSDTTASFSVVFNKITGIDYRTTLLKRRFLQMHQNFLPFFRKVYCELRFWQDLSCGCMATILVKSQYLAYIFLKMFSLKQLFFRHVLISGHGDEVIRVDFRKFVRTAILQNLRERLFLYTNKFATQPLLKQLFYADVKLNNFQGKLF